MLVHVFSEIVDERNFLFQFRWMISNRTESLSEVFVDILQFVAIFMQDMNELYDDARAKKKNQHDGQMGKDPNETKAHGAAYN